MSTQLRWLRKANTTTEPDILQARHYISRISTTGTSGLECGYWSEWGDIEVIVETIEPQSEKELFVFGDVTIETEYTGDTKPFQRIPPK